MNTVSSDILNHINAGDISGAIDKLDCKKICENDLIKGVTKDLQIKLDNKKLELQMKAKMVYTNLDVKIQALDKIKDKIIELKTQIQHIEEKLNESTYCNICFDDIEKPRHLVVIQNSALVVYQKMDVSKSKLSVL